MLVSSYVTRSSW